MPAYIALMSKVPGSDYGVYFPDFQGCVTAGLTAEEAYRFAHEALQLHIDGMAADGDTIPHPSAFEQVLADPEHQDTVAFLVSVSVPKGKAVRVNLTFDEAVLADIDMYAKSHGKSRSGFLAEAAQRIMQAG